MVQSGIFKRVLVDLKHPMRIELYIKFIFMVNKTCNPGKSKQRPFHLPRLGIRIWKLNYRLLLNRHPNLQLVFYKPY